MAIRRLPAALLLTSLAACAPQRATPALETAEVRDVRAPVAEDRAPPPEEEVRAPAPPVAADDVKIPAPEPTGSAVVRVVDRSGAPWPHPIQVSLFDVTSGGSKAITWTATVDGTAVFPKVPLGRRVSARAFPNIPPPGGAPNGTPPLYLLTVGVTFDGPAAKSDTVEARIVAGAPRPAVVGRLVDADGRPAAAETIRAELFGVGERSESATPPKIASDGTFRMEFDVEPPERGAVLRVAAPADPRTGARYVELRRVEWTREHAEVLNLGDVALPRAPELPVVVAGRLVVPEGLTLDWAHLEAVRRADGWWSGISGLSAKAEPDGRFEIRGPMPPDEELWLIGKLPQAIVDAAVPFRPGATDVEVRVVRPGRLEGTVRLPRGTTGAASLEVTVEGEATGGGTWSRGFGPLGVGWPAPMRFSIEELHPGTASIVVRDAPGGEPLARIDGVVIRAGETTDDARLSGIDLREKARVRSFRVVDSSGRPVVNATVHLRASSLRDDLRAMWRPVAAADGGVARCAVFGSALDVVATAPGLAPADAYDADADLTLTLLTARPSRIKLRLDPAVALPDAEFTVAAQLVWAGTAEHPVTMGRWVPADPRGREHFGYLALGADRTATAEVATPGRWRATLAITHRAPGGGRGQVLYPPRSGEVLVTNEPQDLEIVVGVDAERLAQVCRDLAK